MIYTCTMTPSVDYTTYLPSFQAGTLNRANQVNYYPGGKGINVSRVLKRFGITSTALGFIGGFTGDYIAQKLEEEGILTEFIQTNKITRINVKIRASSATELNGPAPIISKKLQQELLAKINSFEENDWFVLAGSIPSSIAPDFLEAIAETCKQTGVRFVVDTSGKALQQLIKLKPYLVKPNEHELGELFHTTITTTEQAIHYGKKLIAEGIQYVIISLGSKGAIYISNDIIAIADPLQGEVINTVGAGDSMVAGFIAACSSQKNKIDAFRYAVAAGSATAFSNDLCEKSLVESLVQNVTISPYSN
ncbi:1-phosphofructokinase [Virgibacillus proomii]|uniref:1-phosphofructokinase n=1 Tax=Virgibacillus proomii TaxID=84407 RepID=UPI001C1060DC|nr:1-phosphofructokinase [Virgibacillus proomii]MBU5265454.1 1-phosphofructokinase [Virgibacillus proomii]